MMKHGQEKLREHERHEEQVEGSMQNQLQPHNNATGATSGAGAGAGVGGKKIKPCNNGQQHTLRSFKVWNRFSIKFERGQNLLETVLHNCTLVFEKAVLLLGPVLICFASCIIYGMAHTFFTIVVPMLRHKYGQTMLANLIIGCHISVVIFLLVNITFNYGLCVATSNKGKNYDRVVRELAFATGFVYPETPREVQQFQKDYEDRMVLRMRRRQVRAQEEQQQETCNSKDCDISSVPSATSASNPSLVSASTTSSASMASATLDGLESAVTHRTSTKKKTAIEKSSKSANRNILFKNGKSAQSKKQPSPKQIRNWMLMAPDEWGYCRNSKQPKPPRSHYDHVTKTLVLCLDHYCPWMFNAVGYFNYRYFCNFLFYVFVGMMYGAALTYHPFVMLGQEPYRLQVLNYRRTGVWARLFPMVPFPSEKMAISLAFMLCLAIGIAVFCLGGFHFYLILTGQTTIEFHGNLVNRRKAKANNKKYKNPYDVGYKRNWQQVYGTKHPLIALLPSNREPEFLPLPLPGDQGKRRYAKMESISLSPRSMGQNVV